MYALVKKTPVANVEDDKHTHSSVDNVVIFADYDKILRPCRARSLS